MRITKKKFEFEIFPLWVRWVSSHMAFYRAYVTFTPRLQGGGGRGGGGGAAGRPGKSWTGGGMEKT